MKRLVSIITLAIILAMAIDSMGQTRTARQNIPSQRITRLDFRGKSNVQVVYDSVNYVEVSWPETYDPQGNYFITVKDRAIIFNDTTGKFDYQLHVDRSTITSVRSDKDATVTYPGSASDFEFANAKSSFTELAEDIKNLIEEYAETFDSVTQANGYNLNAASTKSKTNSKRKYSVSDRTNFDFHWAFNNWGDQPYNGLMKLDGPYNLRTSFSSYQLSENYAVVMTEHTKLSIGIGYESDVYKFTDNYVSMNHTTGALVTQDQAGVDAVSSVSGTNLGDWSTRLVTRYVTLPIEFEYRDKGVLKSFKIALGVVPGLSFNTSHTGLKHELEKRGRNYQDVEDVSNFINPYKLDVRLTFKRKLFGMFIQIPTIPLFIDTDTKIYPIKIGFML